MQRSYHERRGYRETQEQSRVQKPGPGAAKILPPHEEEGAVVPELKRQVPETRDGLQSGIQPAQDTCRETAVGINPQTPLCSLHLISCGYLPGTKPAGDQTEREALMDLHTGQ